MKSWKALFLSLLALGIVLAAYIAALIHRGFSAREQPPMANVVRDPREHPDAIIPNLTSTPFGKFTEAQVALVYGSVWKQRYFTKIGDDYFPEPAQWDVTHRVWRPYFVAPGTDWWEPFYPPNNMERPTGPTCDGCHSVNYNIHTKQVTEWNVGCERCHGPARILPAAMS